MSLQELIEKWNDVLDCADEYAEKTLIVEFLEDLHDIHG